MEYVVGVFVDGSEIKVALLSKSKKSIEVIDTLIYKSTPPKDTLSLNESNLNVDTNVTPNYLTEIASKDQIPIDSPLLDLINKFHLSKPTIVSSVTEPSISHLLINIPKKRSKKINEDLLEYWHTSLKLSPSIDKIFYTKLEQDNYLSVYVNETFPIYYEVEQISHLEPRLSYIASADLLLSDFVLKNYKTEADKTYAIVYVGKESSRIIFLQENQIKYISSYLAVGTSTENTGEILTSKISLEMDVAQIPFIEKIFLCGEKIVLTSFPTLIDVEYINLENLWSNKLSQTQKEDLSSYILAILPAYYYLTQSKEKVRKTNLLPKSFLDSLHIYKFNWSVYLILGLVFLSVLFYTIKFFSNNQKMSQLQNEFLMKQELITQNVQTVNEIENLRAKIESTNKVKTDLNELAKGAEIWSNVILKINDFKIREKGIWLSSIASTGNTINVQGLSLNIDPLLNFSEYLPKSSLKNILAQKIRNVSVNRFELNLEPKPYSIEIK